MAAQELGNKKEEKEALKVYQDLTSNFPDNISVLLRTASTQFCLRQNQSSIYTYQKIRNLDSNCVDQMDEFAQLLRIEEKGDDLNRLCHDLISVSPFRPETWVAVALYSDLKGEKDKAVEFLDKAISLNRRHVYAYHLKGSLLLELNRAEDAATAHFKGYMLKCELVAFEGNYTVGYFLKI